MTSYPIYMTSQYCFHDHTKTIPDISPTMFDITATVSGSSHSLYRWHHNKYGSHHTWHTYDIIHILYDITFTVYDINAQYFDIKNTIFDIISMLSLSTHPLYWWYHTNCTDEISSTIYDDIISIVCNNIFTIFVASQPLYLCLTPTLSMISHPLHIWHCTHYMCNIWYIL